MTTVYDKNSEAFPEWDRDLLVHFPFELVAGMSITAGAKDFLTHVGLPAATKLPYAEFRMFPLYEKNMSDSAWYLLKPWEQLRAIGTAYYETRFFIRNDLTDDIVVIGGQKLETQFVNTGPREFALSLHCYAAALGESFDRGLDDSGEIVDYDDYREKCLELFSRMRTKLEEIDPIAYSYEENFWPVVVADLIGQI